MRRGRAHERHTDLEDRQARSSPGSGLPPSRVVRAVPDDPDDDHLLAAALEGRAAFLVTSDQHVLSLGEYEGVRIVTPAEFLKILGEPKRA